MRVTRKIGLHRYREQNRGFSLTEMAVVVGISAIVLGAIWAAVAHLYLGNQVRTATQELESAVHSIRAAFAEQGGVTDTGGGALTQALDQIKAFPLTMRQDQGQAAGVLFNPWSDTITAGLGSVTVDADNCTGAVNTAGAAEPCFGIKFTGVPRNACILLVTQTSQNNLGLNEIQVNGGVTGLIASAAFPLPVPASTARTKCSSATSNTIWWMFSVRSDD